MAKIEVSPWKDQQSGWTADVGIFACTFESRAIAMLDGLQQQPRKVLVLGSPTRQGLSYKRNAEWYAHRELRVIEVAENEIDDRVRHALSAPIEADSLRVALDVSSFSRVRLASIIALLLEAAERTPVEVMLGYSLASFVPPPRSTPVNREVAPVHPRFSGLASDPSLRLASLVGLGYEQDKALGAVEYLQSNDAWLFVPTSPVTEYLSSVLSSNELLLEITARGQRIEYPVLDPAYTFSLLESSVQGLTRDHKVALLPFGPKIFFALNLLVASTRDDVGVWHVSGEDAEDPVDRTPSTHQCICHIAIFPTSPRP